MNANKQLMTQLRDENKELRKALAALQREASGQTKVATDIDEVDELTRQVMIFFENTHNLFPRRLISYAKMLMF